MVGRGGNGPSQQGGLEVEEEAHTRMGWEHARRGERHTEARPTVCTRHGAAAQRLRTAPSAAVFIAAVSRVPQPCTSIHLPAIGTKEHLIVREVGAGLRLVRVAVRHESPHARATSKPDTPTDENR